MNTGIVGHFLAGSKMVVEPSHLEAGHILVGLDTGLGIGRGFLLGIGLDIVAAGNPHHIDYHTLVYIPVHHY